MIFIWRGQFRPAEGNQMLVWPEGSWKILFAPYVILVAAGSDFLLKYMSLAWSPKK